MSKQYYDSALTGAEIDKALKAVSDLVTQNNNGKILTIENGKFAAKKPAEIAGTAVLEALNVSANGDYYPESGVDGFDEVHVSVPSYPEPTGTIQVSSNGTVNVKDYASAEVNVPSEITAADEGKVVKNGALVAQTARATEITENGTYDTTENNEVTVNVQGGGGSSGVYVGITDPDSSIGSNGDYYYKRFNQWDAIQNKNSFSYSSGSQTKIYGIEFYVKSDFTITKLRGFTKEARTGKLRIGTTSDILAEKTCSFEANKWTEVTLDTPVSLTANTHYIVQVVIDDSFSSGKIGYTNNVSSITYFNKVIYVASKYGGFPGTSEANSGIMVDFTLETPWYVVEKQYYKSNGQWSEI